MPKPTCCPDCYFECGKVVKPAPGSKYCDFHGMLRDYMRLLDMILLAEKIVNEKNQQLLEVKKVESDLAIRLRNRKREELKEAA